MDEGIVRVFQGKRVEALHTQIVGRKIHRYDTAGSTNDLAFIHALKDEKEGAVFWARAQTKGRGRQGRRWVSHKDKGIYFSIILRPDILAREAPRITLLIAVAVCRALRDFSGRQFLIKWPNDIIINEKKIGGILTEMDAQSQRVRFLIAGIGIDTNFTRNELPVKDAVSLKMLMHKEVSNESVLAVCLKEIDSCYAQFKKGGFSRLLKEARQLCGMWGKQIRADSGVQGVAVDFDSDAGLVVRQASGFLKHLYAGEVTLLR